MPRDARAYLADALAAARLVAQFLSGRTFAEYQTDPLLRSAVERQFEIVGEALARLSRVHPDLATRVPDVRRIVDFRNVLAHGYATIDDAVVWQAANRNLPPLVAALAELIAQLSNDGRSG